MNNDAIKTDGQARGSRPSVVEAFGIRGLHGYRDISLQSAHAASILIARNGSGKTTLLGVLDAFLRCQYSRLKQLEFDSIFCKFRDLPEQVVLTRSDLDEALEATKNSELSALAARAGILPDALQSFLEYWSDQFPHFTGSSEHPVYASLYKLHGYSSQRLAKAMAEIKPSMFGHSAAVSGIALATKKVMKSYDLVYLPTYRRVEITLKENSERAHYRRKRPQLDVAPGTFYSSEMQFGLTDISDRLNDMNEQITIESNREYRRISAAIINDLLDGLDDRDTTLTSIPSREDLTLLFSRVERSRSYGPYDPASIPDLDKIYSQDVPKSSRKFLNYFLGQLDRVISRTKDVESKVQDFVSICNSYLSTDDVSARVIGALPSESFDAKELKLDRKNLKVRVVSVHENRPISLDAMSSGEKQMISLFAKLYLYDKPKIVLIDEPELSLSLDWQRRILVDVINSPHCDQLIAITHSPFVFENELDCYAGSLSLKFRPVQALALDANDSLFDEGDFDEETFVG